MTDDHNLAGQLAEWALGVTSAQIPAEVLAKARDHSLDGIGTALAATGFEFATAVVRAADELEPGEVRGPAAAAIGAGRTYSPARAALVDGTLIHGLDFDDTHIEGVYHATAPALAAALAVGESVGASRDETLRAYLVGLEVGVRLSLAAPGGFHTLGFHPTGVLGTFAAACVAARLRGDTVDTLRNALGVAGSMAAGILEIKGSWLKRLHPGWAASSAITAVTLAAQGFLGPPAVFEGPLGVLQSHAAGPVSPAAVVDRLGERWELLDLAVKPYPCCHFLHGCVDAAFAIREEHGASFGVADVQRIEVKLAEDLFGMVVEPVEMRRAPTNAYDALFSVQYVTGAALHSGSLTLDHFYGPSLGDPAVLAWTSNIDVVTDPGSAYPKAFPGEVAVQLRDGTEHRVRVEHSTGTAENPLTADQLRQKFVRNAAAVLGEDGATEFVERWGSPEDRPLTEIVDAVAHRVTEEGAG